VIGTPRCSPTNSPDFRILDQLKCKPLKEWCIVRIRRAALRPRSSAGSRPALRGLGLMRVQLDGPNSERPSFRSSLLIRATSGNPALRLLALGPAPGDHEALTLTGSR